MSLPNGANFAVVLTTLAYVAWRGIAANVTVRGGIRGSIGGETLSLRRRRLFGRFMMVAVVAGALLIASAYDVGTLDSAVAVPRCSGGVVGHRACRQMAASVRRPQIVLLGTSITRVAADEITEAIPGIVFDAANGRGWRQIPSGGGTTLWQAYLQHRSSLQSGDWLVMEASLGGVPAGKYAFYTRLTMNTLPRGVCLAWVIPHNYYPGQDAATAERTRVQNDAVSAIIRSALAKYPCHALVEWDQLVTKATASTPNLTPAQREQWQPLCYDGRHPSATGQIVLATAILEAITHPMYVH